MSNSEARCTCNWLSRDPSERGVFAEGGSVVEFDPACPIDEHRSGSLTQLEALQLFLQNRGYEIRIDGWNGPVTQAARGALLRDVSPETFNSSGALKRTLYRYWLKHSRRSDKRDPDWSQW
jgi:hypothetical protein